LDEKRGGSSNKVRKGTKENIKVGCTCVVEKENTQYTTIKTPKKSPDLAEETGIEGEQDIWRKEKELESKRENLRQEKLWLKAHEGKDTRK